MNNKYEVKNTGKECSRVSEPKERECTAGVCDMCELTEKQSRILECISGFIKEHGFSPTVREVQLLTGYRSTSSVHAQLHKLADIGVLSYESTKPRTIVVLA